jgi:hypothetical protein
MADAIRQVPPPLVAREDDGYGGAGLGCATCRCGSLVAGGRRLDRLLASIAAAAVLLHGLARDVALSHLCEPVRLFPRRLLAWGQRLFQALSAADGDAALTGRPTGELLMDRSVRVSS